jgi:hypothetical protein
LKIRTTIKRRIEEMSDGFSPEGMEKLTKLSFTAKESNLASPRKHQVREVKR